MTTHLQLKYCFWDVKYLSHPSKQIPSSISSILYFFHPHRTSVSVEGCIFFYTLLVSRDTFLCWSIQSSVWGFILWLLKREKKGRNFIPCSWWPAIRPQFLRNFFIFDSASPPLSTLSSSSKHVMEVLWYESPTPDPVSLWFPQMTEEVKW